MAIVNVDLSEYDSLCNRAKELEEQNKELKEQVKDFKSGSKVIIRVVEDEEVSNSPYFGVNKRKRIISESYVGFEDVRLKVEEAMKAYITLSIDHRNEQAEALEKERKYLKETMGKEYEGRIQYLKDANKMMSKSLSNHEKAFDKIKQLSYTVLEDLNKRFLKPASAILLVESISSVAEKRDATVEDSGIKY